MKMESAEKKRITSSVLPALKKRKTYHQKLNKPSKVNYMRDLIPEHICIHIFRFLSIEDLIRVAGVCKGFRELIHSTPRVWRDMHLRLSCKVQKLDLEPEVVCKYAIQFAAHCQKLTINYYHCLKMADSIRNLLVNLRPISLTSLVIIGARRSISEVPEVSCIIEALTRMLSGRKRLQKFGMTFAFWEVSDGIQVLEPVLSMSKGTLESLRIEGFFDWSGFNQKPVEFNRLTTSILLLNNLTELGLDYGFLTDAFVNALARSNPRLKNLRLFDEVSHDSTSILKDTWVNLTESCPEMKVAFRIHCLTRRSPVSILGMLDPVLKVRDLRILYKEDGAFYDWSDVSDALYDIRSWYRESLVTLVLDVENTDKIDKSFLQLVRQCEHLVYVNVSANFHKPGTEKTVMKLIQQRRRKLNMKKTPQTSSRCLRKHPAEGPSSNTADTKEPINVM
ncbi:uncharacterized protein LOC131939011 [Physella acuta]|uniref:uncharacterized protein LOC131939011 n=1 Tax=Physella acuta TaxID=109671 RepID=UPI0027DAFE84|nr:uncharacterized protein LOC131939011 [Physella acuta]